jgi:hypothetical protein
MSNRVISGEHARIFNYLAASAARSRRCRFAPACCQATLRNWEQGRSHPDAPTRVLLAVIAKHPEAVEDVLRKAS